MPRIKCGLSHKANVTCNQALREARELAKATADSGEIALPAVMFNNPNTANNEPANSANSMPVPANTANTSDTVEKQDDVQSALSDAIAVLGKRTVIGLLNRAVASKDRNAYQRELMRKRRAAAKMKNPPARTGG
ncbi:UNVERIFIED_ORG: hypothetical protein BDU10_3112 [Burkholderia sp. CF145]